MRPTGLNGHLSIIAHTESLLFAFEVSIRSLLFICYHLSNYAYGSYSTTQEDCHFSLTKGVVNHSRILNGIHNATLMSSEVDLLLFNLKFNREQF